MHSPNLLHGPYLQCDAINLFLVEFEWVLQIFFDALDEFPSDVPWAAQYVLERHIDALFVVFRFVPGSELQQVVQIKVCISLACARWKQAASWSSKEGFGGALCGGTGGKVFSSTL